MTVYPGALLAFPTSHIAFPTREAASEPLVRQAAADFTAAAGIGVLASLGATDLRTVPGAHSIGGLAFTARILPFTKTGDRVERPARMGVLVSVTGLDEIDIQARRPGTDEDHARIEGIYIDQLAAALLALDYNGPEILNPRYWPAP